MATTIDVERLVRERRRIRIDVADGLATRDLVRVLGAVDDFNALYAGLAVLARVPLRAIWLPFPFEFDVPSPALPYIPTQPSFYDALLRYRELVHAMGGDTRIVRASIASPGFISVEGGEAVAKLVDILHKGGLQKEELRAIIQRIGAETRLLNAQALSQEVEAMARATALMKSLGYSDEQIREAIGLDGRVANMLSAPIVTIEDAQARGVIARVRTEGES